jgi:membrane-associated protein
MRYDAPLFRSRGLDFIRSILHRLGDVEGIIRWGGYYALAGIVFSETGLMVGFFLPGDSLLVTAGLFAAKGVLNIGVLIPLLIGCAVAGNATGYLIGRSIGPRLFKKEDSFLFKKKHLLKTQQFYDKHGGKTIILAQFIPVLRTFAPVVAGVAQMKYRKFFSFNVVGAICWITSMLMIGYALLKLFPGVEKHIHVVILIVIFVSMLPGIIEFARAKMKREPSSN